jgi:hypothetical protein
MGAHARYSLTIRPGESARFQESEKAGHNRHSGTTPYGPPSAMASLAVRSGR